MPYKPRHNCGVSGCPNLAEYRQSYCAAHIKSNQKQYDQQRGSQVERGYNWHWQKLRKRILLDTPICQMCKRQIANEVHHINGNSKDNNISNLMALCKSCHSSQTISKLNVGEGRVYSY